ncbi:MAG: glycosyltransferase family 4 protein [Chlamydiae bacterium]|nr:glycosyltransferase family 4 protein [Chlamydiota bacterium]
MLKKDFIMGCLMSIDPSFFSTKAKGGTELMKFRLIQELGIEAFDLFQLFVSQVNRPIDPSKISLYWIHEMPDYFPCKILENRGWNKFDYLIFTSDWQLHNFQMKFGIPFYKSKVLKNAIDPLPNLKKAEDKIRLIYHSTPHRGLDLLVPVFTRLCEKHSDIELHVYSSFQIYNQSRFDANFKSIFDICKSHPNIRYFGSVSNQEVKMALCKAHIFAYPSIWHEVSCIALMEAMSAGLVCVHPNLAGLIDTSGGITRMYHWQENHNDHKQVFHDMLDKAICDVRDNLHQSEVSFVKEYADRRFTWSLRTNEWKEFLNQAKIKNNKSKVFYQFI